MKQLKGNSETTVITLSNENLVTPTESFNHNYVSYGDTDDYPDYLLHLYKNSALHSALTKGISQFIAGSDVYDTRTGESLDNMSVILNTNNYLPSKVMRLLAFEYYLNGYAYLEVIRRGGGAVEFNILPCAAMRNVTHPKGLAPTEFIYSNPTTQGRSFQQGIRMYAFDGKRSKSVIYIKGDDTALDSYSTPPYCGAINDIELDISSKSHKLNSIKNGFFPSALINVTNPTIKDDQTKKKFERGFTNKYAGDNGSRLVFSYNPSKEHGTTIDTFEPPNIVEFFKGLTPDTIQSILVGHRVTSPLLFGVKLEGTSGLGSNTDEIKTSYSIFTETTIKPNQLPLIDAFNLGLSITAHNIKVAIKQYKPSIFEIDEQTTDASAGTDKVVSSTMQPRIIEGLKKVGEKVSDYNADGWHEDNAIKMAIESDPKKNSYLDTDTYRVRYRYVGPRDSKNRTFCADVLDLDLIYRKEDIDAMSLRGENEEFGKYDIFTYKGNKNCRHRWEQVIFKKLVSGEEKQLITKPKINYWLQSPIFTNALKYLKR